MKEDVYQSVKAGLLKYGCLSSSGLGLEIIWRVKISKPYLGYGHFNIPSRLTQAYQRIGVAGGS